MIARTLALAVGLMAATIASQFPEFTQQYRQRLGGAIDELQRIVDRFDTDASASGITRDQALGRMQTGPDDFVRRRGVSESATMNRLERLEHHRETLESAGPVRRLGSFLRYGDAQLADRTLRDFEPAVPVTAEGLLTAAFGFILGWGLVRAVAAPFRRGSFRRRLRRAQPAGSERP